MPDTLFAEEPLPDVLYKYLAPARHDVVRDMRIRFSQPSALNDPYEGTIAVAPFAPHDFPGPPEIAAGILMAELNSPEFRDQIDASIGVLALSRVATNTRLWALYADGGRGFCVGFRTSAAMFAAQDDPEFQATWMVKYLDAPPLMPVTPGSHTPSRHALPYMLRPKSTAWKDEEEVRVVRTLNAGDLDHPCNDDNQLPVRRLRFDAKDIVSIVFGARATENTRQLVSSHCETNGIKIRFERAYIPQGSYRLVLEPLDAV